MTDKNITEEALLKQEKEKVVADLKKQGTIIGQAAVRTLLRTTTVHLIGRKVAPQIFSSFGRSYAVLLLVDMLKTKRHLVISTPQAEKATGLNVTNVFDQSSFSQLRSTTFRTEAPKVTKGYSKGDHWYVVGEKDETGSAKIMETHIFDGTRWVPTP